MKLKFLRLFLISSFVLVGCKSKGTPEPQLEPTEPSDTFVPLEKKVNVKMEKLLVGSDDLYTIEFDYSDSYFLDDARLYDKDLSLLSLGMALSATYLTWSQDFFRDTEFSDVLIHDLDKETTKDTLGYTFAHRTIKDHEVFAVAIRGHEYKREWANNFIIGEEGDHEGWLARTTELYSALSSYITQYKGEKPIKLWIAGYSRAGAISDMLASMIIRSDGINVDPSNLYVYTFEAPASLTEEHAVDNFCIHNIVNSADIVTYIPPTQYGLHRPGRDFEIYDMNFGTYVADFDSNITVPNFVTCKPSDFGGQSITNDVEFAQYIINDIFADKGDDTVSAHTRELYVANYQTGLSYMIGLLFGLKTTTRTQAMSDLTANMMNVLLIISDTTGQKLSDFLKTYLDMDEIDYDEAELLANSAVMIKAVQNLFIKLLGFYTGEYKNNLTRVLDMHYPEVTYTLLKEYHTKLDSIYH